MVWVLVVEDDLLLGSALKNFLTRRGYKATVCNSPDDAIEQLENNREIGAVLLDIMMDASSPPPGKPFSPDDTLPDLRHRMGGLRVAKRVPREIPVIVLSGANREMVMEAARENALEGALYWFSKPLMPNDYERLLSALESSTAKGRR
jgi:CheY-like chemotaxis protein